MRERRRKAKKAITAKPPIVVMYEKAATQWRNAVVENGAASPRSKFALDHLHKIESELIAQGKSKLYLWVVDIRYGVQRDLSSRATGAKSGRSWLENGGYELRTVLGGSPGLGKRS